MKYKYIVPFFSCLFCLSLKLNAQEVFFKQYFDLNSAELIVTARTNDNSGENKEPASIIVSILNLDSSGESISYEIKKFIELIPDSTDSSKFNEIKTNIQTNINELKKDVDSFSKSVDSLDTLWKDSSVKIEDYMKKASALKASLKKLLKTYDGNNEAIFELENFGSNPDIFEILFKEKFDKLLTEKFNDKNPQIDLKNLYIKMLFKYSMLDVENPIAGTLNIQTKTKVIDLTDKYKGKKRFWVRYRKLGRSVLRTTRDRRYINYYKPWCDTLKIKDSDSLYQVRKKEIINKTDTVSIENIQLEICEGEIWNITVKAKLINNDSTEMEFTNAYKIPFSTKKNYSRLNNTLLYNTLSSRIGKIYVMELSQLLDYSPGFSIRSCDYSPENKVYNIDVKKEQALIGKKQSSIEKVFHKESISKLFKIKVFSDLTGFGETNPNGIIQTEFSKYIYLNHNYNSWAALVKWIEPKVVFSKVEKKENYFTPEFTTNNNNNFKSLNPIEVTSLESYHYANRYIGTNANVFTLNFPRIIAFLEINEGLAVYRTNFQIPDYTIDSLNRKIINHSTDTSDGSQKIIYKTISDLSALKTAEVKMNFMPDNRWGLAIGTRFNYTVLWSDELTQEEERLFYTPFIHGYFKPNAFNEFYFRAELNKKYSDRHNFLQLQVGYSYYLSSGTFKKK